MRRIASSILLSAGAWVKAYAPVSSIYRQHKKKRYLNTCL
jgi:hypothetical protein